MRAETEALPAPSRVWDGATTRQPPARGKLPHLSPILEPSKGYGVGRKSRRCPTPIQAKPDAAAGRQGACGALRLADWGGWARGAPADRTQGEATPGTGLPPLLPPLGDFAPGCQQRTVSTALIKVQPGTATRSTRQGKKKKKTLLQNPSQKAAGGCVEPSAMGCRHAQGALCVPGQVPPAPRPCHPQTKALCSPPVGAAPG